MEKKKTESRDREMTREESWEEMKKHRAEMWEMRCRAAEEQYLKSQLEQLLRAFPECGVNEENMTEELGSKWACVGNLRDAYVLLNHDRLVEQAAAAARQQALNELRRKSSLSLTAAGGGTSEVRESDLKLLRRMLPGRNDRELRRMLTNVK